uniref:FUN14 domain-containing protein 2 n=1 Tax=Myotis myotis TaxID=51298 RepID=A0A7J7YCU0_MYOMY|nr:FUN14 domain containing 2 [Myotis myotis]
MAASTQERKRKIDTSIMRENHWSATTSTPPTGDRACNLGHFESLDLAEYAKKQPWWRKLFGQETGPSAEKYSVATQLLIGGVTGWCTGFIFQKVGKLAATAVGGGFFLLQIANHTGYIKIDWQRVEKDMKKAKEQLKIRKSNHLPTEVKSKAEEVVLFVKKNVLVTGGFFGGFLLGMAS